MPNPASTLDIRDIVWSDIPALAELYRTVFNAPPWNDAWTTETAALRLQHTFDTPGSAGVLALDGERAVAAILGYREQWFDGEHFYLKEMFVHPEHQRRGIGAWLLGRVKDMLRRQGVARIYLLTERDGDAEAFYRAQGFYRSQRMIMMGCSLEEELVPS